MQFSAITRAPFLVYVFIRRDLIFVWGIKSEYSKIHRKGLTNRPIYAINI